MYKRDMVAIHPWKEQGQAAWAVKLLVAWHDLTSDARK